MRVSQPVIACLFLALSLQIAWTQGRGRDLRVERNARRFALLIGNNAYSKGPLQNAVNDVQSMRKTLMELGFTVDLQTDADLRRMEIAIDQFVKRLRKGDVALFYYAGHGMQIENENYLIPVDFRAQDEVDAKYGSYAAGKLVDKLELSGAALKIVILDACRNNPYRVSRSAVGGLAQMNSGVGTFIAFATGPNSVAMEVPQEGGNGVFTKYLVSALREPGLTLDNVFSRVREDVFKASRGDQLPWISSSVIGEFYFKDALPAPIPANPVKSAERVYWSSIENSNKLELFEGYLKQYPSGEYSEAARKKLAELRSLPVEPPRTAALPGRVEMNSKDRQEYVLIAPGTFTMGCVPKDDSCEDDEKPARKVTITQAYWIGRTEVTVGAYKRFAALENAPMPEPTRLNPKWTHTDHPITRVTWDEAQAFCKWAGGRLPTEAEWEYAARGGNEARRFPWGDSVTRENANFLGTGGNDIFEETAPSRYFDANPWDLYDVSGNVWEWVGDWYDRDYYAAAANNTDPTGPSSGKERVLRGGSWFSSEKHLRLSIRKHWNPEKGANYYGFRCVLGSQGPLSQNQ